VIIEAKPGMHNGSGGLPHHVDLSRTLVITGSKPVLKRASKFMQTIARAKGTVSDGAPAPMSLEDYVEWKMGDFVKGMRNGSGRNLHPMLISAIEPQEKDPGSAHSRQTRTVSACTGGLVVPDLGYSRREACKAASGGGGF
jgi:hypothetical protein